MQVMCVCACMCRHACGKGDGEGGSGDTFSSKLTHFFILPQPTFTFSTTYHLYAQSFSTIGWVMGGECACVPNSSKYIISPLKGVRGGFETFFLSEMWVVEE